VCNQVTTRPHVHESSDPDRCAWCLQSSFPEALCTIPEDEHEVALCFTLLTQQVFRHLKRALLPACKIGGVIVTMAAARSVFVRPMA